MLNKWYDNVGPQNIPWSYDLKSRIFLPKYGNGYSVVDTDSLETIWRKRQPWIGLLEFNIELCACLDQMVALFC